MKEFNKMEKSIRDIMEGFEMTPSVAQKDIFLKNVLQRKTAQKRKKMGFIFSAAFSGLVALSSIFFICHEKNEAIKSNIALISNSNTANPSSISKNETPKVNPEQHTISELHINQPIVNSTFQSDRNTIMEQTPIHSDSEEIGIVEAKEDQNAHIPVFTIGNDQTEVVLKAEDHKDTNKSEVSINEPDIIIKASAFNRVFVQELESSVGIYYRPEVIFNIIENDKYIHNFGIEFKFHPFNPRYEIRTGFGLSVSKGYYEYQVNYNQYVGSYHALDSVSFSLAENGFNLIPEYYFSNADVYNDYLSTYHTKIYRQHVYLQIPLEMGYDFVKTKKECDWI